MITVKYDDNHEEFIEYLLNSAQQTFEEIGREMQLQITEKRRLYPRETKRRNGDVVSSPRDVVDLGELRDSMSEETLRTTQEVEYSIKWDADHAQYVFVGTTHGDKKIPPYPWTSIVLAQKPPIETFKKVLREAN
jgi:hypothetical protein